MHEKKYIVLKLLHILYIHTHTFLCKKININYTNIIYTRILKKKNLKK